MHPVLWNNFNSTPLTLFYFTFTLKYDDSSLGMNATNYCVSEKFVFDIYLTPFSTLSFPI